MYCFSSKIRAFNTEYVSASHSQGEMSEGISNKISNKIIFFVTMLKRKDTDHLPKVLNPCYPGIIPKSSTWTLAWSPFQELLSTLGVVLLVGTKSSESRSLFLFITSVRRHPSYSATARRCSLN